MSEHRTGAWPVTHPVDTDGVPPPPAPVAMPTPAPRVREVRLVVTVDLAGSYGSSRDVADHLREQARRSVDCHTVVVRLGADAVRHHIELGRSIAAAFYLDAERIEIHAPAGNVIGPLIHDEVARYVRLYQADHERAAPAAASG